MTMSSENSNMINVLCKYECNKFFISKIIPLKKENLCIVKIISTKCRNCSKAIALHEKLKIYLPIIKGKTYDVDLTDENYCTTIFKNILHNNKTFKSTKHNNITYFDFHDVLNRRGFDYKKNKFAKLMIITN